MYEVGSNVFIKSEERKEKTYMYIRFEKFDHKYKNNEIQTIRGGDHLMSVVGHDSFKFNFEIRRA